MISGLKTCFQLYFCDFNILFSTRGQNKKLLWLPGFINNSEDNIQTQVLSGSVNENECLGLLYIDTSSSIDWTWVTVTSIEIMGTSCSGYNGLVVLNTYYVMIQTSTISDVSSNKYEILYFNTITYLYFISMTLNNLNEYIPSVVTVSNTRYLEIVDTTGTNLQSDYGSPFTLNKVYDNYQKLWMR